MKILKTMLLAAGCVAAACCLPLGQHKPSHEQIAFLNTLEERTALALGEQERRLKSTLKSAQRAERQALHRLNEATTARHAAEIQLAEANRAGQNMISASATIDRGQTASSGMVANAARKVEAAEVRERSAQHGYTQAVQRRSAAEDAAKQNAERVRLLHAEVKALATEYAVRPSQELLDRLIEKRTELAAQSGVESYVTWRTVKMEARTTKSGERWHTSPSPGALLYYVTKRGRSRGDAPVSLRMVTDCEQSLGPGAYYVWSQRGTRITSDKDRPIYIAAASVTVEIVEDR